MSMRRICTLLLLLIASTAAATQPAPHGVVLMYHRFDEARYPSTSVRMPQFIRQLDYMQQNGYRIWPLRRLLAALHGGEAVPDRTVALTVDDAYLSVYRHAFAVLRERAVPLTVFVSTGAVDAGLPGFMSWEQMREMARHGIDFANHGTAHLHLTRREAGESQAQWLARIRRDITHAQTRIEQELGPQGTRLFAYPFGEYNSQVAALLRELGYLAFGQHSGAIAPYSDPRALPRFPINEHFSDPESFARKLASLPLPLAEQTPWEPQTEQVGNPPLLALRLRDDGGVDARSISCYLGDGTPLQPQVHDPLRLTVRAPAPLGPGRSRYNCTAPAGNGRYYWFSQPWFNGPDPADPAR